MAKIFSVNPVYEILIEEKFIVRNDDDFISIELPAGFNWSHHSQNCIDCKAFLNSFGKNNYRWLLEASEKYYRLDLVQFGTINDHFFNLSKYESSNDFYGSRMRFKITEINEASLEALQIIRQDEQQFERCAQLRDNIKFLENINHRQNN